MTIAELPKHRRCMSERFDGSKRVPCDRPVVYLGRWHMSYCRAHRWLAVSDLSLASRVPPELRVALAIRELIYKAHLAPGILDHETPAKMRVCPLCQGRGEIVIAAQ